MIRWATARFIGNCRGCRAPIMQGDTVAFQVPGKRVLCPTCGRAEAAKIVDRNEKYIGAAAMGHCAPKED